MHKSILVFMLLASLPAAAAQASPLQIDFTGTFSTGFVAILPSGTVANWGGLTFSGRFVFDPATAAYDVINADGSYHFSNDNYGVPHSVWMLTTLSLPGGVVQSGNDSV